MQYQLGGNDLVTEFGISRLKGFLALLALLPLACATLPHVDAQDVVRAKNHFPAATLSSLDAGRRAFADNCAGCHALPRPEAKSAEEWSKVLDEMAQEAKLTSVQKDLIAQFLMAKSRPAQSVQLDPR